MPEQRAGFDVLRITGMHFFGKHGISERERERAQPIDVDVRLSVNLRRAAKSDKLAETVDYVYVFAAIENVVTQQSFQLLEALADACLTTLFKDKRIRIGTIRVRKPRLLDGATPEVEMTRVNPA